MKVHAAAPPEEEEEEELVDPMDSIRQECVEKHCANFLEKLNECNDRKFSNTSNKMRNLQIRIVTSGRSLEGK
ncbi:hypothetical protein AVEN_93543-1 [Araneus ventricosus]|uniref:Ubiquinol-cytochrome C reductase hinge domain-containing protein n=1 Tax=Araneus ventricosus TaxID=182803 RepID=A0A4Y2ARG3_ARAVE|nr:hypothetical protein AVEN_93543-1 [Araneus ventricosus]